MNSYSPWYGRLASLCVVAMICVSGCSGPRAVTSIIVQLPSDLPGPKSVSVGDVLTTVGDTAAQFGLSNSWEKTFISNEYPKLWLNVRPDDFPFVVEIVEDHSEYRSHKHRQLADSLVAELSKLGLTVSVTYHTPDPIQRGWAFYVGAGMVAAFLFWRRSVRDQKTRERFAA